MSAPIHHTLVSDTATVVTSLNIARNDTVADVEHASIQIPEECWEPVDYLDGDETGIPSQLLTTLYVNGCPMHFEAYLVDEQGEICDPKQHQSILHVKQALRDDECWNSFGYEGHPYVMIAIPFGACR